MKPHEQRVVDEKAELSERLEKLNDFISSSPIFEGLPEKDQSLLVSQKFAMSEYEAILTERISRF